MLQLLFGRFTAALQEPVGWIGPQAGIDPEVSQIARRRGVRPTTVVHIQEARPFR
jgi:hypothetical protein